MDDVGSLMETLEVANSHSNLEVSLLIVQAREEKFTMIDIVVKQIDLVELASISRFVGFNPRKIQRRILSKKGRMEQVK